MYNITAQAQLARAAALELATIGTKIKNTALLKMAQGLRDEAGDILMANAKDIDSATQKGMSTAFIERLTLTPKKIEAMANDILIVVSLSDPIGEIVGGWVRPNGLKIMQKRVPLGVIGIIYESRPNVTADAAVLCIKSGNSAILRGGSDAINSNLAIMNVIKSAASSAGLPNGCLSLVEDTSREIANEMMRLNKYIDVLIPRGGKSLIDSVVQNAKVPVIQTGDGICHIYVDGGCDLEMAQKIAVSAKISRPSVCNSAETLLIDSAIAEVFAPGCLEELRLKGVEVRGCEKTRAICQWVLPVTEEDWDTEYNDMIYSVRIVDGIDEAIDHINLHGTRHSETIVTNDYHRAQLFQDKVDAAAVYVNASTRFTDGGEFGFGAEIGISNQKLHARGPMGLKELTTLKYVINGNGQIR